jgi:hypothetical protein
MGRADTGGASRFYYVAKASREEREFGCEGLVQKARDESRKEGNPGGDNPRNRGLQHRGNFHPTVKPIALMRWLVRLVTPLDGVVLDPFTGSGTTGMACRYEHRSFVGIEREAEYVTIAERRIAAVAPLFAETPQTQCPKCGEWLDDLDGFGVLRHEKCGYCSHPSVDDGECNLCDQKVGGASVEQ